MFKYTQTYETFNGEEITEDFFFNLTEAELTDMEVSVEQGYSDLLTKVISTKDRNQLITIFKKFIDASYGVKSGDGKRFYKSPEILADYKATNAYSDFFVKLASDSKLAAEFVTGILPSKLVKQLKESGDYDKAISGDISGVITKA